MPLVQLRRPSTASPDSEVALGGALMDRQSRTVRYLRVSLTDRCNYRCTYCMPEEGLVYGPRTDVLSLEEVVRVCEAFARWGVTRVRLTGGEPTLRRGLVSLVERLAALPTVEPARRLEVVMTTNGERLAELAEPLARAGLRSLTVSLDSLDPERFGRITRRGTLERVLGGVEAASRAGLWPLKINTVAISGFNDDELASLVRWAWERDVVPRFIELMPMASGELYVPGELLPAAEIRARVEEGLQTALVPDEGEGVRGAGPASYWRAVGGAFDGRRLGTIAALTENFCSSCNRLRISATGQLHACLARDDTGDLRSALRSQDPDRLERVVRAALGTKRDAHGFNIDGTGGPTKAMVSIGG
ncbi:GTP 3',8-cyclase MoaA [Paraliomyxa miuraensis]|uniref:GTP 3',8-cyclase MoaA n=1 Tax=Paraliomyxa miuraensis TaxID=376150 RepID=UPI0022567C5A|nr:GTP 3',8-cyclase MoaA [Paraliomyxa miuraensis]MCX4239851.1 GTP 3',8-cyclase MoaA [Paraliomyxa miuraensis]